MAAKLDGTVDVLQIFSTYYAFAALRADGSVVTWGGSDRGGNSSAVADQLASGVVSFANIYTDDVFSQTDLNQTLNGTDGNDVLTGGAGNDTLDGGLGADTLDGGLGVDSMVGGLGNDSYYISNLGEIVIETSTLATEIDTVISAISYSLGTNVENLSLSGTSPINGTGNSLNNLVTGNSVANNLAGETGNDTLDGGKGADTLDGGAGADKMTGGLGKDIYYVENPGDKAIETSTLSTKLDKVISAITFNLGANVENLILAGTSAINGTGNLLGNRITGNSAANHLTGKEGADTLVGGLDKDSINLSETKPKTDMVIIATGDSVANNFDPKKSSLHLIQVREGNLVDVIAGLEDTLPAPN